MPIEIGMYNALLQPPKSALDYANDFQKNDLQRQAIQSNALAMQGKQQELDQVTATNAERNWLRNYLADKDLADPKVQQGAYSGAPLTAGAFLKTYGENQKLGADTKKVGAETDNLVLQAQKLKVDHAIQLQGQIAQAAGAAHDQASWDRGLQIAQTLGADISNVPKVYDPATATALRDQAINSHDQLLAHQAQLDAAERARHNQADEALTKRGQDVSASTSRANTAANIAKDYTIAGIDPKNPSGGVDASTQAMVDAIGQGKIAPPNGMALRNPRMQSILAQVAQQYPNFDATDYAAKTKAARDFSTGQQGNAMRSFAVAGQHLDQLNTLIDALDNRDNQTLNKVGNTISAWNGNTPVTNFDAAKDVVSKEVIKAIVGSGGGVAEREELSHQLSNAKSPQQLKGVVQQYRNLMSAQHDALLQQRRGAGLPDSTLPKYTQDAGSGLPSADAIAAEMKRRGL